MLSSGVFMGGLSNRVSYVLWGLVAGLLFAVWALARDDGEGATLGDKLVDGATDVLNTILRGTRVTRAPYSKVDGVVRVDPQSLADQAGVSLEVYSLARMISSEEGSSDNTIKAAVAWAVVNHAQRSSLSIYRLLTRANNRSHAGFFGTQRDIDKDLGPDGAIRNERFNKSDRYASTASDPYSGDVMIAQAVLDGRIADLTNGADQFDRPDGESDPEQVAANRRADGATEVPVEGIDGAKIRFWSRVG